MEASLKIVFKKKQCQGQTLYQGHQKSIGHRKKFEEIELEEINNRIFNKANHRRALKIRDENQGKGPNQ